MATFTYLCMFEGKKNLAEARCPCQPAAGQDKDSTTSQYASAASRVRGVSRDGAAEVDEEKHCDDGMITINTMRC